MTRTKFVAVVFAALLVTVGTVAAAPGNAPVDVGTNDQYDDHAERGEENAAGAHGATGGRPANASADDAAENADDGPTGAANADASNADRRGPPASLPAQVPDHASRIHDLVGSFLSGALDGALGDAVSGATPDDANGNVT